jgi:hypothetical protein
MNWIHPTGRWGNGSLRLNGSSDAWLTPSRLRSTGRLALEQHYETPDVGVMVRRWIDREAFLHETYTFTNKTARNLTLEEGAIGIFTPFNDRYPGADICLTNCCHAHLWPGGHFAYINAIRMGGAPPHLGLVLTEGTISDYSIDYRPETSNDRGWVVLHPGAMSLAPGERRSVSFGCCSGTGAGTISF